MTHEQLAEDLAVPAPTLFGEAEPEAEADVRAGHSGGTHVTGIPDHIRQNIATQYGLTLAEYDDMRERGVTLAQYRGEKRTVDDDAHEVAMATCGFARAGGKGGWIPYATYHLQRGKKEHHAGPKTGRFMTNQARE